MGSGPGAVWDLANEVLDAVVASYAEAGVALPGRQYATTGDPAEDCEQLVVWVHRIFTGLPGAEVVDPETCGFARTLECSARVTRCVPIIDEEGMAPTEAEMIAGGEPLAVDAWVLPQGLIKARSARSFLTSCQNVVIGNCLAVPWSGGFGSVELLLRIQIDELL